MSSTKAKAAKVGEATPKQHPNLREPWKPGESGNPAGRPTGSRNQLGEAFLKALHADFQKYGATAIEDARAESPLGYVRVCASILPKTLKIERDPLDEMTDDQIREFIARLDEQLRPLLAFAGIREGVGEAQGKTRH